MTLTDRQIDRFSRQIILPMVGGRGQQALLSGRVLLIGCGGLGCPVALGLCGAGVGHLTLVDDDRVELSNLHRQLAFTEKDIGRAKVTALAEAIAERSSASVTEVHDRADAHNLRQLVKSADLVVDGSDNFATRFAVSDACVRDRKPLVSGAVSGHSGQLIAQEAGGRPCYRCLFEDEPEHALRCDTEGVLPGAVLAVSGMMVQWSLLALMGRNEVPFGQLLQGDLITGVWRSIRLPQRPDCHCNGAI